MRQHAIVLMFDAFADLEEHKYSPHLTIGATLAWNHLLDYLLQSAIGKRKQQASSPV